MPARLMTATITAPAGTAQSAPVSAVIPWTQGYLAWVDFIIPDGHVGLTGLQLLLSGTQIAPYQLGSFLTGNADKVHLAIDQEFDAGQLSLLAFNTDVFDHSFLLRAEWAAVSPKAAAPAAPVDVAAGPVGAGAGDLAQLGDLGASTADAGLPDFTQIDVQDLADQGAPGPAPDSGGGPIKTPGPPLRTITAPRAETLAQLARADHWTPATLAAVERLNNLRASSKLRKGQRLVRPAGSG